MTTSRSEAVTRHKKILKSGHNKKSRDLVISNLSANKCQQCHKTLSSKRHLNQHIKVVHEAVSAQNLLHQKNISNLI
jgi:hypothetical protein